MKNNYWISWYSTLDMGEWELQSPWWISGHRHSDDALTICAAIKADSPDHARIIVILSYDNPPSDIEWRFCEERPSDWTPFSDRFPKADWMEWKQ